MDPQEKAILDEWQKNPVVARIVRLAVAEAYKDAAKVVDELGQEWREQRHDPSIDSAYRNAVAAIRARYHLQHGDPHEGLFREDGSDE